MKNLSISVLAVFVFVSFLNNFCMAKTGQAEKVVECSREFNVVDNTVMEYILLYKQIKGIQQDSFEYTCPILNKTLKMNIIDCVNESIDLQNTCLNEYALTFFGLFEKTHQGCFSFKSKKPVKEARKDALELLKGVYYGSTTVEELLDTLNYIYKYTPESCK